MTVKELKTDLQEQIDWVKSRSRNWIIALVIAVVLVIGLLITMLRKKEEPDQSYKVEIERLEEKINLLEQSNSLRDSIIYQHDQRLMENRKTETKIIHTYERIPITVRDLNREQLRDEVTNY